jgi:phosphoglycolate phosphatase-like HAD superfamily hydrolase
MLDPRERRDFAAHFNPRLVTQLFQEMYGGDACHDLYGFAPEHIHTDGYYKHETTILDPALLPRTLKTGVLTGRTKSETKLAMKIAHLEEQIPPAAWVTEDDGVRKPDGGALLLLREKMEFKHGVYIGDTMDDLRVVQNYRETKGAGRARITSCIVLSGPAGETHRRLFLEAGAEIVGPDVNVILQYLQHVTRGR